MSFDKPFQECDELWGRLDRCRPGYSGYSYHYRLSLNIIDSPSSACIILTCSDTKRRNRNLSVHKFTSFFTNSYYVYKNALET